MSALGMTLTKKIAEDTWWKVKWSWDHKFLLGEETLTQLLVLDFVRFMPDYYKLHQCTKKEESQQGTDLEIRIYDVGTQAAKLAVQAKKLYQANKPYQTGGIIGSTPKRNLRWIYLRLTLGAHVLSHFIFCTTMWTGAT